MIKLTDAFIEQQREEAQRKARMDYTSGLYGAELEGIEIGEKRGSVKTIHRYERLLNRPETPSEQLHTLSLADLHALQESLLCLCEITKRK